MGVPGSSDDVVIPALCTVTIDTTATVNSVLVQSLGTLQFEATTARTFTVNQNVTIESNGVITSNTAGNSIIHTLAFGGNLTNNGALDLSTNGNAAGADLRFIGVGNNQTFSGTGTTNDLRTLRVTKGLVAPITATSPRVDISPFNLTVREVNTNAPGFVIPDATNLNGILRFAGTYTFSSQVFTTAAYAIPNVGGIWIDNPNFIVTGLGGSPTNNGVLRVTQGNYNVGTGSGNSMGASAGAIFLIEGGNLTVAGRLSSTSAVSYTQSGGTVTVSNIGHTSSASPSFGFTSTAAGNSFTMSGGTIVLRIPSNGAIDYNQQGGIINITDGTLQIGASGTPNASTFHIQGNAPNLTFSTAPATLTAQINAGATQNLYRDVTIPTGKTLTGVGTIAFVGASPNIYSNTGTFSVSNVTVNKSGANMLQLSDADLPVSDVLTLTNGIIFAGSVYSVILPSTGTYTRVNGFVEGNFQKQFTAGTGLAFEFPVGTVNSGQHDGYTPVSLSNLDVGTTGDGLRIEAVDSTSPSNPGINRISRYWNITKIGAGTLKTDLTFNYLAPDGFTPTDAANLRIYDGATNRCTILTPCTFGATSGTIQNVTTFSPWTIAEAAPPTAASVTLSGRVMAEGRGVANVILSMTDGQGNVRFAVTNPFGFYRFTDVPAGATVTVSCSHKRFAFPVRVMNVVEEVSDLDLVGHRQPSN